MWTKLDDAILDHLKVSKVGPVGFALFVSSLVYANRNLTDGFVPYGVAPRLLPTQWTDDLPAQSEFPEPPGYADHGARVWTLAMTCGMRGHDGDEVVEHAITMLLSVGLWDEVPHGYQIHDFHDYNPTREQVLADREERRLQQSEAGKRSAEVRRARYGTAQPNATPNEGSNDRSGNRSDDVRNSVRTLVERSSNPVPEPVPVPGPEPTPDLKSTAALRAVSKGCKDCGLSPSVGHTEDCPTLAVAG